MTKLTNSAGLALSLALKLAESNPYLSTEDYEAIAIFSGLQPKDRMKRITYYTRFDTLTSLGLYKNEVIEALAVNSGVRAGLFYVLYALSKEP